MSDLAARIGRNIANAREALGVSQRELGRRIGASTAIVPMWEAGQCAPGAEFLLALSDALHVPVQVLLGQQHADPETADAVTWWAGWREGWRSCAENVRAAATLRADLTPPRGVPAEGPHWLPLAVEGEPRWMVAVHEAQMRGGEPS